MCRHDAEADMHIRDAQAALKIREAKAQIELADIEAEMAWERAKGSWVSVQSQIRPRDMRPLLQQYSYIPAGSRRR